MADVDATLRIAADASQARRELESTQGSFGSLFGSISTGVLSANLLTGAFNSIVGGIGSVVSSIGGFVGSSIRMNASLETARLQFTTFMGSADDAAEHVRGLFDFAARTPFESGEIIAASLALRSAGGAALDTEQNLRLFGNAAAATNAPIAELSSWSARMFATLQAGKRDIGEATLRLTELKVITPQTRLEMERMLASGATGEQVWNTFRTSLEKFNGAMALQEQSFKGLTSTFSDNIAILGSRVFEPFFEATKGGLTQINAFLGDEGVRGSVENFGQAAGTAFAMVGEALSPLVTGLFESVRAWSTVSDAAKFNERVVRGVVEVLATVVDAFAWLVRAIATGVQAYYEFRIAGNLLLEGFAHVVEGILQGAIAISTAMSKITFGDTRREWEESTARMSANLGKVQTDITGLQADTESYRRKSEDTGNSLRGFADKLNAASGTMREHAASYHYVAEEQTATTHTSAAVGTGFENAGNAAKAAKEKLSDFAKTSSYEISQLLAEWNRQPPAIRSNEESIGVLLEKYEKLRKDGTGPLPAELEDLRAAYQRVLPVNEALAEKTQLLANNLGLIVPPATAAENALIGIGVDGRLMGETITDLSTNRLPGLNSSLDASKEAAKRHAEQAQALRVAWDTSLQGMSQAFANLSETMGGSMGAVTSAIGEIVGTMSIASRAALQMRDSFAQIKEGGTANVVQGTMSMVTAVASGVGALNEATNSASMTKNAIGGISTGMSMGMQIAGPWGAAIGGAVGLIWAAFRGRPEWARIQSDIERDFGTAVTETLAKLIEKESKETGDRTAAILNHLGDVVKEAGGITSENVGLYTQKVHDLFSMLDTHALSTKQVTQQLNEVFPQLAATIVDSNGVAAESLLELIRLDEEHGTKSVAIHEFVAQNLQSSTAGMTTFLKNAMISNQDSATAMGATVAAVFGKMREDGASVGDALKALQPLIAALDTQLQTTGFSGGAAFDEIKRLSSIASDEISGKTLTAVSGLNDMLKGLHNSGLMNQEMFQGLTSEVTASFEKLKSEGVDGNDALRLMQPTLQTLWEMTKRHGYAVDETTQAMLNEAEANGTVGTQFMSTNDKMLEATERMTTALEGIARAMGVDIPASVDTMERKARGATDSMTASSDQLKTKLIDNQSATAAHFNSVTDDKVRKHVLGEDAMKAHNDATQAALRANEEETARQMQAAQTGAHQTFRDLQQRTTGLFIEANRLAASTSNADLVAAFNNIGNTWDAKTAAMKGDSQDFAAFSNVTMRAFEQYATAAAAAGEFELSKSARAAADSWRREMDSAQQSVDGSFQQVRNASDGTREKIIRDQEAAWAAAQAAASGFVDRVDAMAPIIDVGWNIPQPSVPQVPNQTVNVNWRVESPPDLPQYARGGIVRKATQAIVGEAGPEAIIPLSDIGGIMSSLRHAAQVTPGVSNDTALPMLPTSEARNVNIYLNDATIAGVEGMYSFVQTLKTALAEDAGRSSRFELNQ